MANPPKTRKRVHAIRRAHDGSAFEKCDYCGVLVPIALTDMHECGTKKDVKRFKGICGNQNVNKQSFCDQPRSAFRESFKETCKNGKLIDIDRKGFETWKNMSKEERQSYIIEAEEVNSVYQKALIEEENNMFEVDDEADSAMVGKFDKFYEDYEDYENSDSFVCYWSRGSESLDTRKCCDHGLLRTLAEEISLEGSPILLQTLG